ncbi:flavodoxin family protein [Clostridium felsineum]|uniref:flavodoxin family protein n=1 Tax=Clostridium felsineum TaxID=36839 RepID=UPI00214DB3FB|nr:flavodoxin family protein [Clostridium felsineum]MCR3761649.1 flavodoxin family protein [Clostridium felsineum]
MKKVLVISASSRKGGNSDTLCDEFIKGVEKSGNCVVKIYVRNYKIGGCNACYACRKTGVCVQKDDMSDILQRMIDSDVIVMATPVYFYSMNGQMKTLIDRTLPRYSEIKDKDFYFIATAAAGKGAMERTIDSLRGFTDCLPNSNVKGVIYGAGAWELGDIKGNKAIKEAYEAGKNI